MTPTLEKVTFRTNAGTDETAFLAAAAQVTTWAAAQPGFQYRTLVKEDDAWIDLVFWDNEDAAKSAGQAFMAAEETKSFASMIDMASVTMTHLPQLHTSCSMQM